ncbi:MAG: PspA/IM30 family protein [Gemmatimonadota bacterium]|jgi:phage shock protein A|nr:PspA/IM30 family protein [Gemmatimonadota bacterium]
MGIFDKLSTLVRSNLNDLIARAENPEKMLNQIILDMRDQLSRAKQEVAVAIADERKLKAQAEEEARQAGEWEKRAMLAVREDRDDLARLALQRHAEYSDRARQLLETWTRQAEETEKLKESLRQLNSKIEEARRKKNLLIAKQKRADAQKRIQETMTGLSDRSAFEAFDRMSRRIEDNERLALASAEVTEDLGTDQLERQFKQLENADTTDVRLLELKRQMGMLPPQASGSAGGLPDGSSRTPRLGSGMGSVQDAELLQEFEDLEKESDRD